MCVEFCWHVDSFKTLFFTSENHESNYHCAYELAWWPRFQLQVEFKFQKKFEKGSFGGAEYDLIEEANVFEQLYEIKVGLCEVWLGQGTCVAMWQTFKKLNFTNSHYKLLFFGFCSFVFALGGKVILLRVFFEATILENLLYITLRAYPCCLKHSNTTYS